MWYLKLALLRSGIELEYELPYYDYRTSRRDMQNWIIVIAKRNEKNGKNYVMKRFTIR
jgi:hypothetical protein